MNKKRKILPIILKAVSRIFSVSVVLAAIILFQSLAGMDVLPQKYNIAVVLVMIVLIGDRTAVSQKDNSNLSSFADSLYPGIYNRKLLSAPFL